MQNFSILAAASIILGSVKAQWGAEGEPPKFSCGNHTVINGVINHQFDSDEEHA